MLKKIFLFFFLYCFMSPDVFANNLELKNFDSYATNTSSGTMTLKFDLTQDNSWRNTVSHDAVWLFMKYSTDAGKTWKHASMSGSGINPSGYAVPANFETVVPQDGKGFFFRRKVFSSGLVDAKNIRFVWNYEQDGLTADTALAANTLTRLYGLEMVYVPEGSFFAGDGASSSEFRFKQGSSDDDPWYVTSENALTITNATADGFYYQGSGAPGESSTGEAFLLSNSFPKGYRAFYLMKYELTEGEWVDFFNTLSVAERVNRDITSSVDGGKGTSAVVNRNAVTWDASDPLLPAATTRPARAMSYVSWTDAAAYADWSGLRPMTELEYEKAARGVDVASVPDEFAWGTTLYNEAQSGEIFSPGVIQDETGQEIIIDGTANVNRNAMGWTSGDGRAGGPAQGQKGPLRVGIFAQEATSRTIGGAGYYGNLDLSGNLAEPVVTIGRLQGRQFLGTHGDGSLSSVTGYEGNATNVDWPGISQEDARRGVTGTVGIGYRGGDYASGNIRYFQISSRAFSAKDPDSMGLNRRYDPSAGAVYGARLVRTAP